MLVFPQLVTGASSIYPLRKQHTFRTVVNELGDGRTVTYEDSGAGLVEWELRLTGLTADESEAIETLYATVAGRWGTFTFLDPAGNLLAHSEDFGNVVWTNGPLLSLTADVSDPLGGTSATHVVNTGEAGQAVAQVLDVPGNFEYALSVWARTSAGSSITLTASTTGGSASKPVRLTSAWRRYSMLVDLAQGTESVTFGAALDAGAAVDLFGMQVEAQIGTSDYKRTGGGSGVYASARFSSDSLTMTAQGTDIYDTVVRIQAAEN